MKEYLPYKEVEPNNNNLYDNGTPFDKPELIYKNIKESILYLRDKQPVVWVLIGGQGTGKTTLGIHLLDIYNWFYKKDIVRLQDTNNPQYSQGGTEFLHKLPKCQEEGYSSHQWDEAGKYSRKSSLTAFNKNMDEAMDVSRVHQTAIIICRHDINRIPKEMIEHEIVSILIRCKKRKPGCGYVEAEAYDFQAITHLIYEAKNSINMQYIFNKKIYPVFHFRFKDLSDERSDLLDRLSTKKKLDMWANKDIKEQGLMNIQDIHYKIGMSVVWIRQKIKEHGIKESLVHKKNKYYMSDVLKQIEKYKKR